MKKILIAIWAVLVLCGCSDSSPLATPETKAKKLIKEYIRNNLGDPDSYEEIASSPVDSTFDTPYYELAKSKYEQILDSLDFRRKAMKELGLIDEAIAVTEQQTNLIYAYIESFDTLSYVHNGYAMLHKYRAANSYGGKDIYMLYFGFNKELDTINSIDSITMQDIYVLKEEVEQGKGKLDSLERYERADIRRAENVVNAALK